MIILLHTSKTMRSPGTTVIRQPALIAQAHTLGAYVHTLSVEQIQQTMKISADLAAKTKQTIDDWNSATPSPAIDSFVGDIYSGLQASSFSPEDRAYADEHLRILSGLYGVLKPLDSINPYRLELGYRLPDDRFKNLYVFWGRAIADTLPNEGPIINLAAIEYSKVITPYIDQSRCIAPKFLTVDPKSGEPSFVVVHAKIARGAYARWLIKERITDLGRLKDFNDIGYSYDAGLSTPDVPVFVAREFGGKGLSMRLQ
jgi:cytoplasmic iron level regulating protein YaaA (DUF328/UPF0246 family)